jgi:hypothetical protein
MFIKGNVPNWDGIEGWNWLDFKVQEKTGVVYRMWIGKEDLLVWRMEKHLTMGIDQRKQPEQDLPAKIEIKWTFEISDYDTNVEIKMPENIRQRLGIKDE